MGAEELQNCKNCGAVLPVSADQQTIKCTYCGTAYNQKQPINVIPGHMETEFGVVNVQIRQINFESDEAERAFLQKHQQVDFKNDEAENKVLRARRIKGDNQNERRGLTIGIVILILFVWGIVTISKNSGQDSTNHKKRTVTDTSKLSVKTQPAINSAADSPTKAELVALHQLAGIKVDRTEFRKLYKDSVVNTKGWEFNQEIFQDKNSIADKPVIGLYAGVSHNFGISIVLYTQHIGKVPLNLQSLTFILKGKHKLYKPIFTADYTSYSSQNLIREYSSELALDAELLMLIKLATSQKVVVRFNGEYNNDLIVLPKNQQNSIARQLKLYKGLLLRYDR